MAPAKSTKSKLTGASMASAPATPRRDTPSKASMNDERRWRAQDALDTLTRAEQHRKDKGLMADVQKVAKEKISAMASAVGGKSSKH